jgi:Flp pilus assembly pilin Flp
MNRRGQALIEYVLLLALVALVVIAALLSLGGGVAGGYSRIVDVLRGESTPEPSGIPSIADDFMRRIREYFQASGNWPPDWGDQRFSAIGLNPAEWQAPVAGIRWNPHGREVGLSNVGGDNLQVYVRDINGNLLHLYDGWNIWCRAADRRCFYHSIDGGIEVDLNTVEVRTTN